MCGAGPGHMIAAKITLLKQFIGPDSRYFPFKLFSSSVSSGIQYNLNVLGSSNRAISFLFAAPGVSW